VRSGLTDEHLTRRMLLGRAAAVGLSSALAARSLSTVGPAWAAPAAGPIPLPSPAQVRADFQRMVDFGPRLTGSDSHNRYIAWLEDEFTKAGLEVIPCDTYQTQRWLAGHVGLEYLYGTSLDGFDPRTARDAAAILVWGANPSVSAPHQHDQWLPEAPGEVIGRFVVD